MRKGVLISILLLCAICTMAQEQDPWVGTWTSESYSTLDWDDDSDDPVFTDYKLVIRITKNEGQYNVRAKTIKVKDPNNSLYHKPFTIKEFAGNTICLESYMKKMPYTADYGKGSIIKTYSDATYYYELKLNNGVLHYSHYKIHIIDYDANMNYKGEKTMNVSEGRGNNLDLFNDDW